MFSIRNWGSAAKKPIPSLEITSQFSNVIAVKKKKKKKETKVGRDSDSVIGEGNI